MSKLQTEDAELAPSYTARNLGSGPRSQVLVAEFSSTPAATLNSVRGPGMPWCDCGEIEQRDFQVPDTPEYF